MSGLLCLAFLFVGWRFGTLHATATIRHDLPVDARYAFYDELLGPIATDPQQETKIVLSNPALFLFVEAPRPLRRPPRIGERRRYRFPSLWLLT